MSKHMVHNHGPEDGPGLACHERLIGDCELARLRAENQRLREALRLAVEEFEHFPHSLGYEFTHLPKMRAALKGDNP